MLQQKTGYEKQELLEKINKYEEKVAILAGEIERLTALFREKERGFEQKSLDFMNEIHEFDRRIVSDIINTIRRWTC